MSNKTKLTKRQLNVINDIFAADLDEQAVLQKHNVSAKLYSKWHDNNAFIEQFEKRTVAAHRQSSALIASYAPVAALRLVDLTQSKQPETARKACLDVISMQTSSTNKSQQKPPTPTPETPDHSPQLTEQLAGKILAIIAEEDGN